ncbi:MAG: HlyD family secretion protein [Candidatus Binataceae bacterium]
MEKNGFERAAAALVSHSTLSHLNGAHRQESSAPEGQQLSKGVGRPPLEAEYSGERQETFQRIPRSDETRAGNDAENEKGDSAGSSKPSGRGNILPQHPVRLTLVLIAVALLCAVGLRFWDYLQSYEWTDDAEIEGHLDPISTRIDDTVIHVYVENTFHVSRGQALVDLDPRDYQVAVENAAANLAEAKQSVLAARQDYELSLANLNAAVATNVKAQEDVKRYRELLDQGVIARETDDAVVRNGKIAAASVNSDRAAVAAAAKLIGEAQAAADAAQATLDQAKLNLSYTHIVAPASGVVGDKTVEVGERVQPGEQLLTVVPLNDIWITADFRETQVRRMHRNQSVTVHVDATDRDYKGYVEGMPGASGELFSLLPPENATGNYLKVVQRLPVRIRLYPGQDPDHRLRPGMSVEPTVWMYSGGRTVGITTTSR